MSGLLALLDDVAAIAKVAAASVDDIAGQAVKAGAKAAGAVIDDAAVTPKYVQGFDPSRELPIVGKIALGSLRNKLVILLPAALLLTGFAPWLIVPLLMLGGSYLCFEGAEKVWHLLRPHAPHADGRAPAVAAPAQLERQKVAGAIKTDFILSAEIMTIALAAIPDNGQSLWIVALILALVAVAITGAVYGSVALIVKADDLGLWLARAGRVRLTRMLGRAIVALMPGLLTLLVVVGTAAMIWVGGAIIVHGFEVLGWPLANDWIHHQALAAARGVGHAGGSVEWAVTALFDGVLGLAWGLVLIPVVARIIDPLIARLKPRPLAAP